MNKKLHLFFCLICFCFIAEAQLQSNQQLINSQGLRINLNCYHNSNFKASKQILLIHGLTYSSHEFHVDYQDYSLVRFLANNGYKVWSLDIAGYGASEQPSNGFEVNTSYAAKDVENAVAYILDKENIPSIDLFAWSWGTATSSQFVGNQQGKIRKLILYAPITSGYDGDPPASDWHVNSWEHAASDFQQRNTNIDTAIVTPEVMHTFLSNCWKFDGDKSPNGGRKDLLSGASRKFIDSDLLNLPVLFIGGTNDPYLKWDEIKTLYDINKKQFKSELIKIEGGGHALYIEKPFYRNFHDYILNFLKVN